ncbi:N-acetylmuramoyl-L-alanine amidase [Chitinispirillales bacterium ANBcel5]|uniref:N-acetylmuramoyl-L-alanine amidase n=1 Tax=Cellulosispirillum alkaliphilum TaxID=3039283 RepID=UPI002A508FD1|nr:N-acetylmuramoyl-L-alanine amidase [Chitinispirillales bacterium ANBcel5]
MIIKNHRLEGKSVEYIQTPNIGNEMSGNLPDTIVLHYSAGRDASSTVRTLCNPSVKASAHLVIGRGGELYQLAPFNVVTWHAGKSSWNGRTGLNRYSIGIEIDNAGLLNKNDDSYTSWFGKEYPKSEVIHAVHRNNNIAQYWHRFSEVQIELVEQLCRLLSDHYSIDTIVGHEEISPKRKIDPGPAFPLDKIRDHLLGSGRDDESGEENNDAEPDTLYVTASRLNIRTDHYADAPRAADSLPRGTVLRVLEKSENNWYRVATGAVGWVSGDFVSPDKP